MTVMQLSTDVRQTPRRKGTERLLLSSSDITQNTDILREDVLSRTKNRHGELGKLGVSSRGVRRLVRDSEFLKFTQNVSDLQTFFEVVVLVGIDEL